RKRMHEEELEKIQKNAAKKALRLWNNTHQGDEDNCIYLKDKKVKIFDCQVNFDGDLIVPLFNEKRELWNLQYIKADGSKKFLPGGRKKGCFHIIGTIDLADPVICIAEGYATAASIHMATNLPVVVAFDAGNLPPVGQAIRSLEPNARLLYCADDDSAKEDTG
ncbi:DNA primase, partial [Acinetobacter baumannii]